MNRYLGCYSLSLTPRDKIIQNPDLTECDLLCSDYLYVAVGKNKCVCLDRILTDYTYTYTSEEYCVSEGRYTIFETGMYVNINKIEM